MVDFIVNNYVVIMIVAAFLIFALIGFAVDTTKNKKNDEAELLNQPNEEVASENIVLEDESVQDENVPNTDVISENEDINMNMDN